MTAQADLTISPGPLTTISKLWPRLSIYGHLHYSGHRISSRSHASATNEMAKNMFSQITIALRHRIIEWIRSLLAIVFIGIVPMVAASVTHAQALVVEDFSTDASKDVVRTTADWNTIDSALKLPLAASLTGPLFNVSAAVDAFDVVDTRAVAVGDLNGDGFPDLAFGNNGVNSVYFNNGFGAFTRGSDIPDDPAGNSRSAVIEDFDGDGFLDLLFAEFGTAQATRIHFNNGSGSAQVFTLGDFVLLGPATLKGDSVAAGDVDGDGDIDVVLAIDGGYVKLFRNNGFGTFSPAVDVVDAGFSASGYRVRTVLLGDLDRDGDLDIVSAREYAATRIHLNNGAGNFATLPQSAGLNVANSLSSPDSASLGDVNGDGFPDLFVGNDGSVSSPAPKPNYLFINSGNSTNIFPSVSAGYADTDNTNTNGSRMFDVDRDGDLDIVLAGFATGDGMIDEPGSNRLLLNDGAGNFPSVGSVITSDLQVTKSLAYSDFDRDGDIDLVFVNMVGNGSTAVNRLVENVGVANGPDADQLFATGRSLTTAVAIPAGGVILSPLLSNEPDADTVFRYWFSDDGGLNWISAAPGRSVAFPAPIGNDLRWRVELNSGSPGLRPALDQLLIASGPAPVFTSNSVTTAMRGQLYIYNITARDPDGPASMLVVSVNTVLPAWLTFTDNGDGEAILEGTPSTGDVGIDVLVTLEALDGDGFSATQSFTVTVSDTNSAPTVVAPTGNMTFNQGDAVTLNAGAAFDDPDDDTLSFLASGLPASLSIDPASGLVTGNLTNADAAAGPDYAVVVTADDSRGGTADDNFTITVNSAPVFTSTPVTAVIERDVYSYSITATDADGDALTITAPILSAWLTFVDNGNGTATLSGMPDGGDIGDHGVRLRVSDGIAAPVNQDFTITVTAAADAPVITLLGAAVIDVAEGANYNDPGATASDVQDGDLTADIVVDNPVDTAVPGTYTVTYTVQDSAGNVGQEQRTVNVIAASPTNRAPSFTSTPVTTVTQGNGYSYSITATDADGDALTITAPILSAWLTFVDNGNGTATLSGMPDGGDIGDHGVRLRVSDGIAAPVNQDFTITVTAAADAPVITLLGAAVIDVAEGANYNDPGATASDVQDGDLTADIVVDNPVDTAVPGTYTVTYTVQDSAGNVGQEQRTVNVIAASPTNRAPSFTSTPVTTVTQGNGYSYSITTTDPDVNPVSVTSTTKPAWLNFTDNGDGTARLAGTPGAVNAGANAVVLRVTDSGGLFAEQTFTITVTAVLPPPQSSGGGGGAVSQIGLLILAIVVIARRRRKHAVA